MGSRSDHFSWYSVKDELVPVAKKDSGEYHEVFRKYCGLEGSPLKTYVIVQYGKAWKDAKDKWWVGSGFPPYSRSRNSYCCYVHDAVVLTDGLNTTSGSGGRLTGIPNLHSRRQR